jgi:lysine-specific histone demethylase 1
MANPQFDPIDNSSILYQDTHDLLTQSILTPFSDQKFDLLDSKTDDAPFAYDSYNSLGIYDQYNDSGPSSVHFDGIIEASEHGESHLNGDHGVMNGNVRPDELHDLPGVAGLPLPLSPAHDVSMNDIQINGSRNALQKPNGTTGSGPQVSKTVTVAKTKNGTTPILDSIIVRG